MCSRLFGSTGACSGCGQTIPACEFVMRAGPQPHVFHLKCFACSKCGAQLVPGDRYCLLAGSLVCEQDWHKLLKGSAVASAAAAAAAATPARKGKVGRPRRSRDWAGQYSHSLTSHIIHQSVGIKIYQSLVRCSSRWNCTNKRLQHPTRFKLGAHDARTSERILSPRAFIRDSPSKGRATLLRK